MVVTGSAMAQQVQQQATQQAPQLSSGAGTSTSKQDSSSKVCEYEKVTGSRMKKRVCYTSEQWKARQQAAKDTAREIDRKPVGVDDDD